MTVFITLNQTSFTFGIVQEYLNTHAPFDKSSIAAVSSVGTIGLAMQYILPVGIILVFRRCVCATLGATESVADSGWIQIPRQSPDHPVDGDGGLLHKHADF